MKLKYDWKIAIIGGGGKIAGAVLFELLNKEDIGGGEILLYSRTVKKIENNIKIADRICPFGKRKFLIKVKKDLNEVLDCADIVLYTSTAGLEDFGGYKSLGISQGAHILYIGEKVKKLCPDAVFMVSTNPPDIPLMAVHKLFNLNKLIGLCNAPLLSKKVLSAYLKCHEENLKLCDIGINHDVWFYDVYLNDQPYYDDLRRRFSSNFNSDIDNDYLNSFPEWKLGFINNIELMKYTNYLSCPVGGSKRFIGLPIRYPEIENLMKRPTNDDYLKFLSQQMNKDEIFAITRRCGGGIAAYISDVIESILTDNKKEHSIQVKNNSLLPSYPDDVMLQTTCKIGTESVIRPSNLQVPDYVNGLLASRIYQNDMAASALASQDENLMLKCMMMLPERVNAGEVAKTIKSGHNVEPFIPLN